MAVPHPTLGEELAPQPAPESEPPVDDTPVDPPAQSTGPQLGDSCIGADIGRRATDASGTAIMCDNYVWQLDQGQEPSHPSVDGQRAWAECIETKTPEECRVELDGQ